MEMITILNIPFRRRKSKRFTPRRRRAFEKIYIFSLERGKKKRYDILYVYNVEESAICLQSDGTTERSGRSMK